jgi:putative photosynthetic complex assembly protein
LSSLDERPFPAAALIGAGMLMMTTVVGVGIIQLNKHFHPQPIVNLETQGATLVHSRDLRFVDEQDGVSVYGGHVRVFDVATGKELTQLSESDGFVRAVLNALTYERTKSDVNAAPVFTLTQWSNGAIIITDKASGAHVNVEQYGHGNKIVFARFFKDTQS